MQLKWSGKNRMQLVPNSWLQYTVCLHPVCLIWICQDFSSAGGGYWLGSPLFSIPYTCMKSLLCAASVWTDLYLAACAFFFPRLFSSSHCPMMYGLLFVLSPPFTLCFIQLWCDSMKLAAYCMLWVHLMANSWGEGGGGSSKEAMLHIKTEFL